MKIKVVMESGNAYYSEKDINVDALTQRIVDGVGASVSGERFSFITLDHENKVRVNIQKISEIIEE